MCYGLRVVNGGKCAVWRISALYKRDSANSSVGRARNLIIKMTFRSRKMKKKTRRRRKVKCPPCSFSIFPNNARPGRGRGVVSSKIPFFE